MKTQPLSFIEKAGYSCGDAAANFVFMTMVLFQLNFYTDVFGLSANTAAAILLWPRLWDAIFDPVMGVLADRTETRWGKFRIFGFELRGTEPAGRGSPAAAPDRMGRSDRRLVYATGCRRSRRHTVGSRS